MRIVLSVCLSLLLEYTYCQETQTTEQQKINVSETTTNPAPQNNVQDTPSTVHVDDIISQTSTPAIEVNEIVKPEPSRKSFDTRLTESLQTKITNFIKRPILKFVQTPRVNQVLKNIGTCIVNGAMDIVSFFFPPAFIPLIASVASMMIPFEPVIMLREKIPVKSYRRALQTAVSGFLGTFDRYKENLEEEDPYMTRRFNRRFMNDRN